MSKKYEKFLTIGILARLTGVHVKSLRYYDEIGILPPAFIDRETGYRYYTQQQVILVEAIQLCVELDIPLKNFQIFLGDNKHKILFSQLMEYGTQLANAKIKAIHKKLEYLEDMQKEINRGESLPQDGQAVCHVMPPKLCWVVPFEGEWGTSDFYSQGNSLYLEIKDTGWKAGYEMGILSIYSPVKEEKEESTLLNEQEDSSNRIQKLPIKYEKKQFIFTEVSGYEQGDAPYILELPGGKYLCRRREQSGIRNAPELFPQLFAEDYEKVVVEVELYAGDYHMLHPEFEVRCIMG